MLNVALEPFLFVVVKIGEGKSYFNRRCNIPVVKVFWRQARVGQIKQFNPFENRGFTSAISPDESGQTVKLKFDIKNRTKILDVGNLIFTRQPLSVAGRKLGGKGNQKNCIPRRILWLLVLTHSVRTTMEAVRSDVSRKARRLHLEGRHFNPQFLTRPNPVL